MFFLNKIHLHKPDACFWQPDSFRFNLGNTFLWYFRKQHIIVLVFFFLIKLFPLPAQWSKPVTAKDNLMEQREILHIC